MNDQEAAAALEPNECELTLDIVDKIALRFATAMLTKKGFYVTADDSGPACVNKIMEDAYDAANDFLKEKIKHDEFEIQVEVEPELLTAICVEHDDGCVDEDVELIECYGGCNGQFLREDVTKSIGQHYYCQCCWENLGNIWKELDADDDQDDCDSEPVAVVKALGPGKIRHLIVNDIPAASIGSFCSSEKYRKKNTSYWSAEGLERAARDINEGTELEETKEEDRPPIAFVQNDFLGSYLVVNGTTVCRAGEVCRDSDFRNSGLTHWTTAAIELVAERINKAL